MSAPAIHPKTAGASGGAAVGLVVTALLNHYHVHVTPQIAGAISTITAAIGGYVAPRPHHEPQPPKKKPQPKVSPVLTMYDAIDVAQIPTGAAAVAGYVDGHWPTYARLRLRFRSAYRLSIAVFAHDDAHCLDVEQGDASPEQAVAWVKRQLARGVHRPAVYASVSVMPRVLGLLHQAGIGRGQVRIWTAHYTFSPHLCSPRCGYGMGTTADATQYTDRAHGRNLDASLVAHGFWHG
jgi:hypothetical protein